MSREKKLKEQRELIKSLKDSCKGETVIILGCSPFLLDYDNHDLKKVLGEYKVLGIKQSYKIFKNFIDIHVYNCCNIEQYEYSDKKPLVIEASSKAPSGNNFDLFFHIQERNKANSLSSLALSTASDSCLDDWSFSGKRKYLKSAWRNCDIELRPCGPGIMSEIIFFICEHMGFSEIILIGCDNESSGKRTHFYRDKDNQYSHTSNDPHKNSPWINFEEEKRMFLGLMDFWNKWFLKKNTELKIVSKFNNYPSSIKKIELNEILQR